MIRRRGFALLAVLWVVVALGALAAGAVARARFDASATGDRVILMRTRWAAEGCLTVALSRLDETLKRHQPLASPVEDTLHFANGAACTVTSLDPDARQDSSVTRYGDGRVNVNAAPDAALGALPGIGAEALRVIAEARTWHRPLADLFDLTGRLSPPAREQLLARYADLLPLTSFHTSALVLTARGWTEGSRPASTIEVLVVSAGERAAVVRRRMF